MKHRPLWGLVLCSLVLSSSGLATNQLQTVQSEIQSMGLFKNGLATVHRSVEVPGPGRYQLDVLAEPVHGTFWIESNARITTRATTQDVEVPLDPREAIDF